MTNSNIDCIMFNKIVGTTHFKIYVLTRSGDKNILTPTLDEIRVKTLEITEIASDFSTEIKNAVDLFTYL